MDKAQGSDANINSYATWMNSGSLIFQRGLYYDCMIAQSRHRYNGFGGENHVWNGEALFQPEVAQLALVLRPTSFYHCSGNQSLCG